MGIVGRLDVALGSIGAVAGGFCGAGILSGVGAVGGGAGGFALGTAISHKAK